MGAMSRRKGARIELSVLHALQDAGIDCEKLSRMYLKTHDLRLPMLGRDAKMEVKCRANGFKTIYEWIKPVELLVLRADRKEPLVVRPMKTLIELIKSGGKK